jgi:ABC-type uncharacterized transport system ATPase component
MQAHTGIQLKFVREHQSIKSLPATDLPPFSILTGVNGSGKTHLLDAIQKGAVTVNDYSADTIRRYDWNSFVAQIDQGASPASMRQTREQQLQNLLANYRSQRGGVAGVFTTKGWSENSWLRDVNWLLNVSREELAPVIAKHKPTTIQTSSFVDSFVKSRSRLNEAFLNHCNQWTGLRKLVEERAAQDRLMPLALSEQVYRELAPITFGQTSLLGFRFASWFASYHGAREYNKINRYYAREEGDTTRTYVEDAEFEKRYGPEPWVITNQILKDAGVRYRFNHPQSTFNDLERVFELRLIDQEDGTLIQIDNLSSGEKILFAILLLAFQINSEFEANIRPKLLLLDEVDAPLHPSYAKTLVDILSDRLTAFGISTLMTTHSPSTVAVAPAGSVFELVRKPRAIRSVSRSDAAQILSSGFISITPSDTIVITESSADPEYYQEVCSALLRKGLISTHPPLKFIGASNKESPGNGGGKDQVSNWAAKLHGIGLHRFRGLKDRDSGNTADNVVKVLSRHSLENYLYDPLAICAFLLHLGIKRFCEGIPLERESSGEILRLSREQNQQMINCFCEWLADETKEPAIKNSTKASVQYINVPDVELPDWWLNTNGHMLQQTLQRPLNELGKKEERGAIIKTDRSQLIAFQTKTLPEIISKDLLEVFKELQQ